MTIENKYRYAYLLGIGGIGMSAIARYLNKNGIKVFGYDKTSTQITDSLENEGIKINFNDESSAIPEILIHNHSDVLWIYTPAIPQNSNQKVFILTSGYRLLKRSEVLEIITKESICLAVAGTHGKTTTSTYLAHILKSININFSAFLGGISSNYNSNYIENNTGQDLFDKPLVVLEADEFDRSFHKLDPQAAIITSVDADHLDVYHSEKEFSKAFQVFASKVNNNSKNAVPSGLIVHDKVEIFNELNFNTWYYGENNKSSFVINNLHVDNHKFHFTISNENNHVRFTNGLPGIHNALNAAAAISLCHKILKLPLESLVNAISTFQGVKRRFEILHETKDRVIIDDYAHHPSEIKSFIESVRILYPGRKITGVFQPHLFTRTRDFEDGFIKELAKLDTIIIMDIYPARELPIKNISSQKMLFKITHHDKHLMSQEEVLKYEEENKPEILLIMGAGNIDKISTKLKLKYE